jgi:hypothetical protein
MAKERKKLLVWTDAAITTAQAAIAKNPQQGMRQLEGHHNMDPRVKRNLVREYLGIGSHVII